MKALVFGGKISGKGAYKLLESKGYQVEFMDDNSTLEVLDGVDMVVISPSIRLDKPILKEAKKRGIEVVGEIELGYRYSRGNIIAITGTNGKTTTAMMMDDILRNAGKNHMLLGNVGKSFARHALDTMEDDNIVLEVSSYQLESISKFRPHFAIMLNLSEDHIERHGSFDNYVNTKARIFENMCKSDYAIVNGDDARITDIAHHISASKYYFSIKERVRGAYVMNKQVFFMDEKICLLKDLHLQGEHNVENALACITVAKIMGIQNYDIVRSIRDFALPPHRIQNIGRFRDKTYFNDSKATNIDATIHAIKTMKGSTTLIIGGYDKGISYIPLFDALDKNVRSVVIFGQNRHKIEEEIKNYDIRYFVVDSLLHAIERASKERVQNVLFSPATSSYDMFKNYEERGDMFIKLVSDINEA